MSALTTPTSTAVIPGTSASIQMFNAGATITIGHPVYFDSATSTVKEANADSSGSSAIATVIGVALNGGAIGQKIMVNLLDSAHTHGFTASEITPGAFVYLNDTAGTYTVTAGDLDQTDYFVYIGQINNPETTMNLAPKAPIAGT